MRVLIADRNARLLESISRTFADELSIQASTTHEGCNELLLRAEFDLVVVSEKLADGSGLKLLGQMVRSSPNTLRVFAARRSRLQLLQGKLGPLGLFRTLSYPIDPQALRSAFMLARAGLEVESPTHDFPVAARQVGGASVEPRSGVPVQAQGASASIPARAAARASVERISLTSADAVFASDVPKLITSMRRRARRSNSQVAPRASPVTRAVAPVLPTHARQPEKAASHLTSAAPQPARAQQTALQSAAAPQPAVARAAARPFQRESVHRPPMRTKVVLGATIAVVFLVTTLTLNGVGARAEDTRVSVPLPKQAQPASHWNPAPVEVTPQYRPAPSLAQRVEPKPETEPAGPRIAASTPPIAEPSTFGSEAYEAIYSN